MAQLTPYQFEEMLTNQMSGGRGYVSLTSDQKQALRDEVAKYSGQSIKQSDTQPPQPTPDKPTPSTGNSMLDETFKAIKSYLDTIKASGQKINPAIEITPAITQGFITQAANDIDPYYSSQIKAIQKELTGSMEKLQTNYVREKASAEAKFKENLGIQRENEAQAGTIFSGGRNLREQQYGAGAERTFQDLASTAQEKSQALGTTAEKLIGSSNISTYPSLQTYSPTLEGEGGINQTGTRSMLDLTGGVTGSLEQERLKAKQLREQQLKGQYITDRTLNY